MTRRSRLDELEEQRARGEWHLRFSPTLEHAFQTAYVDVRIRSTRRFLLMYLFANLFCLACDYQAGSELFHRALLLRVGVFAPLVIAVMVFLRAHISPRLQSVVAVVPLLVDTALVTLLARITAQPFTDRYLLGAAVGIMAQTLLMPVPFLVSAAGLISATGLLAALSLLPLWHGSSPPLTPDMVYFVLGVGACFLYQRYKSEQSTRTDYLLSEANRLHMEQVLETNAHLERLSSVDSLTGVFNRRYLYAALTRLWQVAQEHERWISVLMVDIDHFKQVNDIHGHSHGDICLENVAQVLQQGIRAGIDTVARYGGEEFVALLPDADETIAEAIASRVRQQIENLGLSSYPGCTVTVSIGVAAIQGGRTRIRLQDFLAAADTALYEAKRGGRNRVVNGSYLLLDEEIRPAAVCQCLASLPQH